MRTKLCVILLTVFLLAFFSCKDKQKEQKEEFPKLIVLKDEACRMREDLVPFMVTLKDSVASVGFIQSNASFYFRVDTEEGRQCFQLMQYAEKNRLVVDIGVSENTTEIVRVEQKWK